MSIIQQIREKAAWLVFGLIALSLVGFLLMDAFVGRSRFFGNKSTTIGVINGEKIEYNDFQKQVSLQEEQYKAQNYPMNEAMQQNIREGVWKQMIEDAILNESYAKLGLEVSDKEVNDMLVGANAIPQVKQAFTDPKTGIFDMQAAAAQINQLRNIYKAGPKKDAKNYDGARRFFEESLPQIIKMRLHEKYLALLANSAYAPKWMIEKLNADNTQIASISYVNAPYFSISDSAVKVSDDDINQYISKHSDRFKQEESRSIAYVLFDAAPTSGDSAALREQLTQLKPEFAKAENAESYLARVGSDLPYFDQYMGKSRIQVPYKDSIFALTKGEVFGPYQDGGSYVLAKKIDEKVLPDSVKARHILVGTINPQTGQPTLDDSSAKKKIDSIKGLAERGQNWDSLVAKFSDDLASKDKGGDMGYFTSDRMVKEFSDYCFTHKTGDKGIVKTQFGYHYIEVEDQKNFEPAYKVAYISRKIETSKETDQNVSGLANQFAGQSRDAKSFEASIQKGGLQKLLAPDITPSEVAIPGLGPNRNLVKWVYESKVGDVSEPYTIGDKYIVAMVTEINDEGQMSASKARHLVEPILRNEKKADQLVKKLGTPASLEAASAAVGQPVLRADSVLFSTMTIPNAGQEPKVVGTAFNKGIAGKPASQPIPGNGGVFVIKVENTSAISNPNADPQQLKFTQEQQQKMLINYRLSETLKKLATVKDDRGKFY